MNKPRQIVQLRDKVSNLPKEVVSLMSKERIYSLAAQQVMPSPELIQQYTMKYIYMAQHPEEFPVTKEEVDYVIELITSVAACNSGTDLASFRLKEEYITHTRKFTERKMLKNPGYFHFVKDNGISEYMYRFYHDIPGTVSAEEQAQLGRRYRSVSALQMDTAFGYYVDLSDHYGEIPASDPAMRQCVQESIWRGVIWRTLLHIHYALLVGNRAKVLELCGGLLQVIRRCGYPEENLHQQITAFDSNLQIKDALPMVFEKPISDYGVTYHFESLFNAFRRPELQHTQDLVRIQGGMSYFVPQTEKILRGARLDLKTGGYCVFDRQLKDLNLMKCVVVLGHNMPGTNMQPDDNFETALRRIEEAVANVGGFKIELAVSDAEFNAPLPATTAFFALKAI